MTTVPIIKHKLKRNTLLPSGKLLKPSAFADHLHRNSSFTNGKYIAGSFYIYQPEVGYYIRCAPRDVERAVLDIVRTIGLMKYISKGFIQETTWFLESLLGSKEPFRYDLIAFNNGTLNLKEMKLEQWSPDLFCTSKLCVDFVPDQKPEVFLKFLEQNFEKDELEFIRAIYWSAITGDNRAQVFIYIYGPGGTGKSTLVNALAMIAGEGSSVTTTFRDLNKDKFEGLNLAGRRLICINDTDQYQGDLSVVKAISGGDKIQGRLKHKDGAIEVVPEGLLIVTGNQPLQTRDPSGALRRRMRTLRMNKVIALSDQKPLLYREKGSFKGPLSEECSGILSWSYMDNNKALTLLKDTSLTKSLFEANEEALRLTNPLKEWVKELKQDPKLKSYLGYMPPKVDLNFLVNLVRDKGTLYPSYLIYCSKFSMKPLSHMKFTSELEMVCHASSIPIQKGRDRYGIYIQGLGPDLSNLENLAGAPSLTREEAHKSLERSSVETSNNNPFPVPESSQLRPYDLSQGFSGNKYISLRWETRNPELYFQYINALGKTPFKVELNKLAQLYKPDPKELLQSHAHLLSGLKEVKVPGLEIIDFGNPSQEYLDDVQLQIEKGLLKAKTIVPFKYKQMGMSPRILPQNYGDSINSVKKFVRQEAYKALSSQLEEFQILDIDLKSCYTAILLGLFPTEMYRIRQAIEGSGLWNTFEEEFKASGKHALFNKPAVKICVYSSFFLGGPRAMINGTLDFMRKEIGLTQKQFDNAPYYHTLEALARDVATFVNNTSIIEDFRNISSIIKKDFDGQLIKGPTYHEYKIDDHQFMTSYPNFLQSFEFYLLAQATLKTLEEVPDSELIGHYHDGNVVIVPTAHSTHYISIINRHLETLRQDLGLSYEQIVEFSEF
jgi:P4 family phage/plasmid primase-like protien